MSDPAKAVLTSPSGKHVKVLCPCGCERWTGKAQDVMCHDCGRVLRPAP